MDNSSSVQPPASLERIDVEPWLRLFERIEATLASANGPEARRVFRTLGPRRCAYANRRLLGERERLLAAMARLGIDPDASCNHHVEASARVSRQIALDVDYELLAEAFALCVGIAQRLGDLTLKMWLLDRAKAHRQHALFLLA